jgi:hypothetical protein
MKGFVYLLEISVAMILILVVLGTISSFKSKENWERADLVTVANYIANDISGDDVLKFSVNDTSKMETLRPRNIEYGLAIYGSTKSNISVGCVQHCSYVSSILTPIYINKRWVNFTVQQFDLNALNYIPSIYDAVVFVNYTGYSARKTNISNYLKGGGVVLGINATYSNNDIDFNGIFGLNSTSSAGENFVFSKYNPSFDETEKYFLDIGFDIATSNVTASKKWGYWTIWDVPRKVNITGSTVDVENKSSDEGLISNVPEGGTFRIKSQLDNVFYSFRVRKIFWDGLVLIQPMNESYVFKDFSESNDVRGFGALTLTGGQVEMASNNTAVWMSDFPNGDDYRMLAKYAIASRTKHYEAKKIDATKKYVTISSFYPLCCDMPETARVAISLWYRI